MLGEVWFFFWSSLELVQPKEDIAIGFHLATLPCHLALS